MSQLLLLAEVVLVALTSPWLPWLAGLYVLILFAAAWAYSEWRT